MARRSKIPEARNATKERNRSIYKTRVIDYSKLTRVQVDDKTTVWVKPGTSAEETIKKFKRSLT